MVTHVGPEHMTLNQIRGCSHITSAAGGGEGVRQMLTIADKGGRGVNQMLYYTTYVYKGYFWWRVHA